MALLDHRTGEPPKREFIDFMALLSHRKDEQPKTEFIDFIALLGHIKDEQPETKQKPMTGQGRWSHPSRASIQDVRQQGNQQKL